MQDTQRGAPVKHAPMRSGACNGESGAARSWASWARAYDCNNCVTPTSATSSAGAYGWDSVSRRDRLCRALAVTELPTGDVAIEQPKLL